MFLIIFNVIYLAVIVLVVWQVVSSLNRISKGVEDIAQTLRQMESRGPQSSGDPQPL